MYTYLHIEAIPKYNIFEILKKGPTPPLPPPSN